MPANSKRITLIAPGCFSALAQVAEPEQQPDQAELSPELNNSTVRATATRSYEQALVSALHLPVPPLGALPVAQHRFYFDTNQKAPPHCVCAELIHLQADKDNARLLPMHALNVTDDESEQLLDSLNDLIRDDGLEVFRANQHSYYLTGMPATALDTWPAHAVANGKIADYLPRNEAAGDWRRLITEVQMLFHAHPVNVARANAQQLPVNGMWFWGGVKDAIASSRASIANVKGIAENIELITDDAFSCGLASALKLTTTYPNDLDWTGVERDVIIVNLNVYEAWLSGDHNALHKEKKVLQEQWITPAQQAVANGQCGEFTLDGCEGQAIVEKPKQAQRSFSLKTLFVRKWLGRAKANVNDN